MIGNNIKRLRIENGMTQKALADKLFVSAQAVSRWENNDVEPSLSTITELSRIFGVSTDEILGLTTAEVVEPEEPAEPEIRVEREYVYREPPKIPIALCTKCNSPIYDREDIFRDFKDRITCRACEEETERTISDNKIKKAKRRRILSLILGIPIGIALIIGGICLVPEYWGFWIYFGISMFTFISCCLLANNFVGEMSISIFSWGFVRMPGLIFSLDLDGCLWFITVKLLLAILGFLLSVACAILAILIGGLVSLFVYPYALTKNIRYPEKTEL